MTEETVFNQEEDLIGKCQRFLADEPPVNHSMQEVFSELLTAYRRLYRQSSFLVKRSDKQQEQLRKLNEMKDQFLEELETLSSTDGLTGIPNRRRFDEFLENEWQRATRSGQPLSLVLMDIDHFKQFNDNYGHAAGDECLIKVAAALSDSVHRPADLVARYGGEEFVCVLPETDYQGAEKMAWKILDNIVAVGVPHAHSSAADVVTMSLGVATIVPSDGTVPADLIKTADEHLYVAKESGRKQVRGKSLC